MARNPESYPLWVQMIGRGLRGPKNGGTEKCIVVDFNPKIRKRTDAMSDSEKIMAWRFHDDLFQETITLTNEKLGIKDELTEEEKQENEVKAKARARDEEYESKRILELDLHTIEVAKDTVYLNQNKKKELYHIFKSHPEFCRMPEYEALWDVIKKSVEDMERKLDEEHEKDRREFYNDTLVIMDEDDPLESFSADKEPEVFEDKLSFDDLMHFINHTMWTQANYQPVMITFLLNRPEKSATRREIAESLRDVNIKPNTHDYEKVPVYNVLETHNVVIRKEGERASDDVFTLNVEELDDEQTEIVLKALKKRIDLFEKRSEASKKANETRGPDGRKRAAQRAQQTKENLSKSEYDVECSDCHKKIHCHNPITNDEAKKIDDVFGFHKNDGINSIPKSQCKECRYENERRFRKERKQNHEMDRTSKIWLYAVTEENWEIVKKKEVWGTMTKQRTTKLDNGDKMIFYVKTTNKIKGIFDVVSDWFLSEEITWSEEQEQNEIIYPYQIKLKTNLLGDIVFKNIKNNLEFVERKDHYNMYLQMHITGPSNWGKPLNTHDYELIREQMNSNESVKLDSDSVPLSKPGFFDRFRKKKNKEEFKEEFGVGIDEIKSAIDEFKCNDCEFTAKGIVELRIHQKEKRHYSDIRSEKDE